MKKYSRRSCLRVAVPIAVLASACGDDTPAAPSEFELLDAAMDASDRELDADAGTDARVIHEDAGHDASVEGGHGDPMDASVLDGAIDIPVSKVCGDAIRGVTDEECDDGDGTSEDVCTEACRARAIGVLASSENSEEDAGMGAEPARILASGGHALAASSTGMAAVIVEDGDDTRVLVQPFSVAGARRGHAIELSAEAAAATVPSPAIAALPDNRFVVAFTEIAAGSPDVALARVHAGNGTIDRRAIANQQAGGPQQEADVLWVGEKLTVAWTDLFDVYVRAFDVNLEALEDEVLIAGSDALETSVALAPHAGEAAIAWRSQRNGLEQVHVLAGGVEWWTAPGPDGTGDRPALASIEDERLALVFTENKDGARRVRIAILSMHAPGEVESVALPMVSGPDETDGFEQYRPCAVDVGGRTYLSWETRLPAFMDQHFIDLVQLEVSPDDEVEPVAQWQLPIEGDVTNDQRNPVLAASPLIPEGALVALWEDHSGDYTGRPTPDVYMSVRPSPILELP